MGGLVETQVSAAIDAYSTGEVASIKTIVETDRKVNELEKAIDDDCAHIIAKRQPTASDLRLILGISKIVTDLERAGDEAKKIAKGVRRIYENGAVWRRCPPSGRSGANHGPQGARRLCPPRYATGC
jgi:phosphate transport system protein